MISLMDPLANDEISSTKEGDLKHVSLRALVTNI
jgi:hypothetical protein